MKNTLLQELAGLILRRRLFCTNIFSGTTRWEEVWFAVKVLGQGPETWFTGPWNARFEARLAQTVGTPGAVSFATGRMALFAILKALGLKPGDEVIIPAFTCVVVPNAILYAGVRPVYGDIEPETFSLDPNKLERVITPRTRVIMAQHTFGLPCRLAEIMEVAGKKGIPVIEDCAHALGGTYQGKPMGAVGEAAFYSLDHSKVISAASGGMAVSRDRELLEKIRTVQAESPYVVPAFLRKTLRGYILMHLLSHPRCYFWGKMPLALAIKGNLVKWFGNYRDTALPLEYPFPARLPDVLARIGLSQLDHLEENLAHRKMIARRFENILEANPRAFADRASRAAWLRYPFLLENRAVFLKKVQKYHDLGIWFTSVTHCRSDHFEAVGYTPGSCPVAEAITSRVVSIPTHQRMMGLDILADHLRKMKRVSATTFLYEG